MAEKSIRVVAAVIQRDEKYLITQRRDTASLPLLWEFPGGKVEADETDHDALKREVAERLGADVQIGSPVAFRRHDYEGYSVELVLYEAFLLGTDEAIAALKVKDYKWVEAHEMGEYPFPPADKQTLDTMDDFALFVSRGKRKEPPKA